MCAFSGPDYMWTKKVDLIFLTNIFDHPPSPVSSPGVQLPDQFILITNFTER